MKKKKTKKVKAWIFKSELTHMLKAQRRGFRDLAEIYAAFWLDKKEAQECAPRARLIPCTITYEQ